MKHILAVYGTLRKEKSNSYLMSGSKYLGKTRINGFKMYSMGGFPAINKNNNSSIEIEVYEITDINQLNRIYNLEGYNGIRNSSDNWYDTTDIDTVWGKAEIFYFKNEINRKTIEDGIWK